MIGDHIRNSFKSSGQSITPWDLFAAAALTGFRLNTPDFIPEELADNAALVADRMMEERRKRSEGKR